MRTAILIAKPPGQPATVLMGPDHIDLVKAEYKRQIEDESGDFERVELWTSGSGRVRKRELKARAIKRPSARRK
jgi:hypothetical protein